MTDVETDLILAKAEIATLTARAEQAEKTNQALVDFAIRASVDFTECDKMRIHISALKQSTGYQAYLIDAKQARTIPLAFSAWMRYAERKDNADSR